MALGITRAGVGLIIGIIVFTLLVLGGLYVVTQRSEQARREDAIEIAEQKLAAASNEEVALNPDTDSSNGTATTNPDEAKKAAAAAEAEAAKKAAAAREAEAVKKADEAKKAEAARKAQEAKEAQESKPTGSTGTPSTNTAKPAPNSATQLPQTGPADAASLLAIGLLAFTTISYLKSRRVLVNFR